MPYTTEDKVREASKLTDLDEIPAGSLQTWIDKAQAKIDARLGSHYRVPLADPVPPIIASIAQDLAAGFAIEKYYSERPDKTEPYLAEVLIKRATNELDDIVEGRMVLVGAVSAGQSVVQASPAVYSNTTTARSDMDAALDSWL